MHASLESVTTQPLQMLMMQASLSLACSSLPRCFLDAESASAVLKSMAGLLWHRRPQEKGDWPSLIQHAGCMFG